MDTNLVEIFYLVDEFCKEFKRVMAGHQLPEDPSKKRRNRAFTMSDSEVITECTGISIIDSTPVRVCHIKREKSHKVFKGLATKGKSTIGWFFGFKLHLIINDKGEIIQFLITQAHVDDRDPLADSKFHKKIFGKLFGDKGYISQSLFDKLFVDNIHLITKIRKNMKNSLMHLHDKIILRKRAIIETVNDLLMNSCQIEHTWHRCLNNFVANLVSGLIAYNLAPKKPALNLEIIDLTAIKKVA